MARTQTREHSSKIELRATDRMVSGIVVPFNDEAHGEVVLPGSFSKTIRERGNRVKLMVTHKERRIPIGRAVKLEERPDGLWADFYISRTAEGDDILTLLEDGALDAFSIEFELVRENFKGHVRQIQEAKLFAVALVVDPWYENARVMSVRSAEELLEPAVTEGRSLALAMRQVELEFS